MTYDEAIAWWYGRVNYEVKSSRPADLKLERMRALLRLLGNPQDRLRLVHVTGTKGKGSTSAMLASVLRASGYRVGLFTSPHLEHVEERIQVDEEPITRRELAARMAEVASAAGRLEGDGAPGLTFFEIGTALGFLHFLQRRCDPAVIEVGLGGRFDSTNACLPLVSVITNVGLDHMSQLGKTHEAIAYQKAGIIKRAVPVVSGVEQPEARAVIRAVAAAEPAPLWELETDFCWERSDRLTIRTPRGEYTGIEVALPGEHQATNAAVAVATLDRLRDAGLSIPRAVVKRGLATVRWPARIEVMREHPLVILDTAHNVPSIEALVRTLRDSFPVAGRKSVVLAVSSDKQYEEIMQSLAGYFDRFYLTRYSKNPRSLSPEKLAAALKLHSPNTSFAIHAAARDAWRAARAEADPRDLVCVTGSMFLAGELRSVLIDPES